MTEYLCLLFFRPGCSLLQLGASVSRSRAVRERLEVVTGGGSKLRSRHVGFPPPISRKVACTPLPAVWERCTHTGRKTCRRGCIFQQAPAGRQSFPRRYKRSPARRSRQACFAGAPTHTLAGGLPGGAFLRTEGSHFQPPPIERRQNAPWAFRERFGSASHVQGAAVAFVVAFAVAVALGGLKGSPAGFLAGPERSGAGRHPSASAGTPIIKIRSTATTNATTTKGTNTCTDTTTRARGR
ncbi:MAG: hypothetical protein V1844_03325 [Pseudomonadota bacterium]